MIQPYDLYFERNSLQHKILTMLCEENLSTLNIVTKMGRRKDITNLRLVLAELNRRGYIRSVGFDQWTITNDGMDAYLVLGGKAVESVRWRKSANHNDLFARPVYDGKELGDNCDRPGAYDYRKHPSVTANRRVWYGPGIKPIESQSLN